jgi:ABC-type multidrug transport system fused ATPase/permease subunit
MRSIWRAIRCIPEYRGRVVDVLAVGTVLAVIGTVTPQVYKMLVDVLSGMAAGRVSHEQGARRIAGLVLAFLVLRAAVVVFSAIQDAQADDLWLDAVSTFRQRVFDNMTRLSIDYFERVRVGEIMDRFGAITQITMWLMSLTEGTLASILQMFFILGLLAFRAPSIGFILAGVVAFNLVISYRTVGWSRPYRRGWQALAGRMSGLLAEMVGNIATVRSFGGEPAVKERYDRTQAEWRVVRDGLHRVEWRSGLALNLANGVGVLAVVAIAAYHAWRGEFTPGDILLVLTLAQTLITTVAPISRQINQMGEIDSSAERLLELLDVEAQLPDEPDAVELDRIESVAFENVSFAYPEKQKYALRNVSFVLESGTSLALVGPSGSGKTTIVKLLMRFYDPTEGRVLINGTDLRSYTQRSVRAKLGVVLQDVALFNDNIGENIAFAKPAATFEEVRAAAVAANADVFIASLPSKYDTLVGERGIKLSGGEKQRVAIARALLKDPELIILDEATSALDSESEHAVQQALQRLLRGRSSVTIAHRLSTVVHADQILVLKEGQVVERGRHASLLSSRPNGLYAKLFAIQTQGAAHLAPA